MNALKKIAGLLTICLTFTACSTNKNRFEDLKLVRTHDYSISLIKTFEDLEEYSDLIVIGEFIDDEKNCYERYSDTDGHGLMEVVSICPMKITRVLSGDANVGDVVNVLQTEGIYEDMFIADSELTPMQKGDEWLFCLGRNEDDRLPEGYWCVSDNKGRYPTKNSDSNEVMCFSDSPELGVYDPGSFQEGFYNKLIEKYGEF